MITETIGGHCPKCGYDKMFMRYGSTGYFQFDACPKCHFAYGNNSEGEYTQEEVWEAILHAEGKTLRELGLTEDIEGLYEWSKQIPRDENTPETVFWYGVTTE